MELEQIAELIDRVSASELDSFCLEQNGMRLSLKRSSLVSKQIQKHKALWCSSKTVGKSTRTVKTDVTGGAYRNRAHKTEHTKR